MVESEFQKKAREKQERLNQVHEIAENVYLTGATGAENKENLQERKITHVLICAYEHNPAFPNDFSYKKFNIADEATYDIKQYFKEAFEWIENNLKNEGRVLLHCSLGASRSASFAIGYRMYSLNEKYEESLKYVRSIRGNIRPNTAFEKQLLIYEEEMKNQK